MEELSKTHDVDIIVTDLKFQNGGFADWLILWPQPFILLFDFIDHNMVDEMVSNETSDFLIRDKEGTYLTTLPHRIRKILNYKESMDRHNIHLQATERRYLDLVQALPDIIYSLDDRGMFNLSMMPSVPSDMNPTNYSVNIFPASLIPPISQG